MARLLYAACICLIAAFLTAAIPILRQSGSLICASQDKSGSPLTRSPFTGPPVGSNEFPCTYGDPTQDNVIICPYNYTTGLLIPDAPSESQGDQSQCPANLVAGSSSTTSATSTASAGSTTSSAIGQTSTSSASKTTSSSGSTSGAANPPTPTSGGKTFSVYWNLSMAAACVAFGFAI